MPRRSAFSLLEIMIVVAIIGLLSLIGIPSFMKARQNSSASAIANNFRVFDGAFQQYNMSSGIWPPPDWAPGAYPAGMQDWLPDAWINNRPIGGFYAFHADATTPATIILSKVGIPTTIMQRVDDLLDDGDLQAGKIRGNSQNLDLVIE